MALGHLAPTRSFMKVRDEPPPAMARRHESILIGKVEHYLIFVTEQLPNYKKPPTFPLVAFS